MRRATLDVAVLRLRFVDALPNPLPLRPQDSPSRLLPDSFHGRFPRKYDTSVDSEFFFFLTDVSDGEENQRTRRETRIVELHPRQVSRRDEATDPIRWRFATRNFSLNRVRQRSA